ncbi:hypothetical protein EC2726950_1692 [Escherichia coli 2726950]|nr:hypothetical protein EC2726950_1692 [Escherichia coli 2726950]
MNCVVILLVPGAINNIKGTKQFPLYLCAPWLALFFNCGG